jgi:hypothetical protein
LRAPRQQYDISGAHDASNIAYRRDPAGPDGHACTAAAIGLFDSAGFDIVAVHGDLLAVYRGVRQFPIPTGTHTTPPPHYEVCRIGADHQITTGWNYEDFPPTIANTTMDPGSLLRARENVARWRIIRNRSRRGARDAAGGRQTLEACRPE